MQREPLPALAAFTTFHASAPIATEKRISVDMDEARAIVARYRPPYTQTQKAMRKAYGITTTSKARKRRRKRKRGYQPTKRELRECREQSHGVRDDV